MVTEHLATPAVAPSKKRFRAARVWPPSVVALTDRLSVTPVLASVYSVGRSTLIIQRKLHFFNLTDFTKRSCLQPEANTYLHCPFPSGVASHFPWFKQDSVGMEHLRPADWTFLLFLHFDTLQNLKRKIYFPTKPLNLFSRMSKTPTGNVL